MKLRAFAPTIAALALAFTAQPAQAQEAGDPAGSAEALAPVPKGRLSGAAVPTSYGLDFYIDPSREDFTGSTRIAVDLKQPARFIDLHGLDLEMLSATATVNGRALAGEWHQLDDTGVARLVFAEELPAGPLLLDFAYRGQFTSGIAGLFNLQSGADHYS